MGPPGAGWMYGRHRLAPTATSILMQSGGGRILKTGAAPRGSPCYGITSIRHSIWNTSWPAATCSSGLTAPWRRDTAGPSCLLCSEFGSSPLRGGFPKHTKDTIDLLLLLTELQIRGCWVSVVTRLRAERVTAMSRPALGPTQPPIQWIPSVFFAGGKAPGAW